MLVSHYDHILVVTSFVVAILASSTALNMAGRVTTSSGSAARIWLVGG
ncbi:MHYT domain-containing protein, partial [Cronobacter sakazakii]